LVSVPAVVADEQVWRQVNVEFGYVEQLKDTQLTISGSTFASADGLDGLLLELADNYRHYIDSTPWFKQQLDLLTGKRSWMDY
jgi:hypothetical protein